MVAQHPRRGYDPALARFAQADTLIPQAGNPGSWDRYGYVNNSPVNASDPTRHLACWDEHANDPGCSNYTVTGNGLLVKGDTPSPKDEDILTPGGEKVKEYYLWAKTHSGWWNDYGSYTLTVAQFLAIYILFEAGGLRGQPLNMLRDAVGYQLWMETKKNGLGGNSPYCTGGICENGIFNFMAAYNGDTTFIEDRFGNLENQHPTLNLKDRESLSTLHQKVQKVAAELIANKAKYRSADPRKDRNIPYHWGDKESEKGPSRIFYVENIWGEEIYHYP